MQCESPRAGALHRSAASTPGQPSQRPVYGSLLHSRAGTRVSRMPSAARALNRVGRSGWSVRGGHHGVVPVPWKRPARPRAPPPALAVGGGAARPPPVRDGGRHRTHSLAAAASCSALQLVAKSPVSGDASCSQNRAGSVGSEPGPLCSSLRLALHACAKSCVPCQLPEHVAPADR